MKSKIKNICHRVNKIIFNNAGFTLIEIIVASAISSVILVMISTAYQSIIKSVTDVSGYAEFYENINLTISKMDKDISNTYYNRENKKVKFIGELEEENSALNFISTKHNEFNIRGSIDRSYPVSDVNELGYYLQEDPQATQVKLLIRREQYGYDEEPDRGGEENILLENVVGLKFEYRMHNDWADTWDTTRKRRLPVAVRTTLRVKNYQRRRGVTEEDEFPEEEFSFITYLGRKR